METKFSVSETGSKGNMCISVATNTFGESGELNMSDELISFFFKTCHHDC